MKKRNQKLMSSLLAAAMLLPTSMASASQGTAGAAVTGAAVQSTAVTDYSGHWAQSDFEAWVNKGLISGYGGGIYKPDQKITRGEWMALINRAFNLQNTAAVSFKDVKSGSAFYSDIQKAVAAGYISGYDDQTIRPNAPVTRQEAAVMLVRLFQLDESGSSAAPGDLGDLPAWSKSAVLTLLGGQYVTGYEDESFKGERPVTRAEALRMIDGIAGELVSRSGDYTALHTRNAVVSTAGVNLKDSVISGNLYLTEGIGSGDITLDNVKVGGTIFVSGGGEHSVVLNNSTAAGMIVNKADGKVRVAAGGATVIGDVYVESGAKLEETGGLTGRGFGRVIVQGSLPAGSAVQFSGAFDSVRVNASGAPQLHLSSGSIAELTLGTLASLVVDSGTTIQNLIVGFNGKVTVEGSGTVKFDDKYKDRIEFITSTATASASPAASSGSGSGGGSAATPTPSASPAPTATPAQSEAPAFTNVSVHDPSIVVDKDSGEYYVFGSHIEAAKSSDLMNWTKFTNGYATPGNVLFGDLSENLKVPFAWAGENDSDSTGGYSVWAPYVFWNADYVNADGSKGAYMMYFCTSSTYIRSAIAFATSQKIEGPYTYGGTLIYSGFTETSQKDTGSKIDKQYTNTNIKNLIDNDTLAGPNDDWFNDDGSYNNTLYPNAIDPDLFYDKDGKLWMVYGSWSGGIFALEIDPATGAAKYPGTDSTTSDGRLIDRYFGTKISGGLAQSGEGPFVIYDKTNGYYYLTVTYGGLASGGGYDMRLFRSTNPDGPYVDVSNNNAVLSSASDLEKTGNKQIGDFLFTNVNGEENFTTYGYVSPGHNSMYIDYTTGKMFNIFHSRFPSRGEIHEVRVHQMFFNEDGWPITSPFRYSGESIAKVSASEIAGSYQFVNHGKDIAEVGIKSTVLIQLNADGTVSGDVTGSWELKDDYYAHLTLNETLDGTAAASLYKGVFVKQWDPTRQAYVMAFTAMSDAGRVVWGSQVETLSDKELAQNIANQLNLGNTSGIINNMKLPTTGIRNSTIAWTSSDESVVSPDGKVNRPSAGSGDKEVELTATVTVGSASATRTISVTVLERNENPLVDGLKAAYDFDGNLNEASGQADAGTVVGNLVNKPTGGTVSYLEGVQGEAAVFDGKSGVLLPKGLIQGSYYTVSLWMNPDQLTNHTTAFFGARNDGNWFSVVPGGTANQAESLVWYNPPYQSAGVGRLLPTGVWSNVTFTFNDGEVTVYVNGDEKYSGTGYNDVFTDSNAIFALGVNYWDTPYKGEIDGLRLYERAMSADEVKLLVDSMRSPDVKVSSIELNSSSAVITKGTTYASNAFVFPGNASNPELVWSSSDDNVATVDPDTGLVTAVSSGSAVITAAATDESGATASYKVTVNNGENAFYGFDGDLSDSLHLAADGQTTGNRIGKTGEGTVTYTDGIDGKAVVLDGTSGIRLPDGLIKGGTYSVSMWLNPDALNKYTTAFFGAQTTSDWISFVPSGAAGKTLLWSDNSGKGVSAVTDMTIPVKQWTHVAFTVDNGTAKVYINGEVKYSGSFVNVFTGLSAVFGVGVNYWDTPFTGKVDDLKVYRRVLSAQEITDEYKNNSSNAVILNSGEQTLNAGDTFQLTANQAVTWSSSDDTVASVDGSGLVTAHAAGTAVITAVSVDNHSLTSSATITVKKNDGSFDPAADLLVLLNFNGNVSDTSGNHKDGTVKNDRVAYVDGRKEGDQAAQFLQATTITPFDNIPVQLPNDLIQGDQAYTVTAWVYWNGDSTSWTQKFSSIYFSDTYVAADTSLNYYKNFGLDVNQQLSLSRPAVSTGELLPVSQWVHVAMTVDPTGDTVLYLNGKEVGRTKSDTRTTQGFNEHFIGGNFWDQNFNGRMDEFRMYGRALTTDEIAALASM